MFLDWYVVDVSGQACRSRGTGARRGNGCVPGVCLDDLLLFAAAVVEGASALVLPVAGGRALVR